MSVKVIDRETYRIVQVTGFLDGHTSESDDLQVALDRAIPSIRNHHVLDLSTVEYVNSSVLGQFLRFLHAAQERNCQVLLMNPPPSVANVLNLTGLTALLPIVASEEEIEAHLGKGPGKRVQGEDVDYGALAQEIETIVKGEPPADGDQSQLGRILGD